MLGGASIERRACFFRLREIETRTEFAKGVGGSRKMFGGAVRFRQRIGPTQFIMGARASVTIAEQIKDRDASAKMLRCQSRMPARHFQQTVQPLSFPGEEQISLGVRYQSGDFLQVLIGFVQLSGHERCFDQQQS